MAPTTSAPPAAATAPADRDVGRMPAAYVRVGLALGVLGYGAVVVADVALALFDLLEVIAAVGFAVAFVVALRRPALGAALGILLAIVETVNSFATVGIMTGSALVLPMLVTVAGLFLGPRPALATGAVTLVGSLVAAFGPGPSDPAVPLEMQRAVVLFITVTVTSALTYVAVRNHRRALLASEEARRRYLGLFESAPDGVLVLGPEGRIEEANLPAAGMFGGAARQGRALPEVLAEVGARSDRPLTEGRPERPAVVELPAGARHRTIEVTASERGGGAALLILRETTDRRALEEQLLHAQRLETVGLLAGGVAHDFNNLLTAIGGNAQLVAEDGAPGVRELAEEILDAQRRGTALTRQLLAFARKEARRPGPLDLADAARGTERLLARILGERNRLELRAGGAVPVVADRAQLEQVLVNLVTNARDASPPGAPVAVAVRALSPEEAASLGCPLAGPAALLEVADVGTGMSAEVRDHIFEPFFTTKPRGQGTGLGLSTVHGIVAQSGGHVAVESEPGRGTAFRVFLPLAADGRLAAAPGPAPVRAQGGGERVLVVEDDAAVRALVERVLRGAGYAVTGGGSGAEALAALADGVAPGLVLTDVALPGMAGPEVARAARARWPAVPVLFMTGYAEGEAARPPPGATLRKPFTPEELLRSVREVLGGADQPP